MSNRKQSTSSDQILEREKSAKNVPAGVPNLANFQYDDTPLEPVDESVNDPVETPAVLQAPKDLEIISQSIRFAPDGTQYVTVVIEFEEVVGSDGYESRTAKV